MNKIYLILAILAGIFIALQVFIYFSTLKTESQAYKVIEKIKGIEIRFYPPANLAITHFSANNYKDLGSLGFRKLAGYIFGGNREGRNIAMTSPVHMDIQDSGSSMAFVMPNNMDRKHLPEPNDSSIKIQTKPEEYVASISFGGFASDAKIKIYEALLRKTLIEEGIPFSGSFRFLGYNPPYQLLGRRNEIIVSINWNP